MTKFTKLFCVLALCLFGIVSVNAKVEQVHATFENPSETSAKWNAADSSFVWSQTSYNQIRNIGLPTGDITKYKKLVVDCKMRKGNSFRILIYKAGANANLTLWAKDGVNEFILADTLKVVSPNEYNDYLLNCGEICLSGSNAEAQGEVKINDMYLETYNDEGEKVYATFAGPTNTSATWNAADSSFVWSQTSYNQIRNIGLPTGDITKYKKLVVDCKMRKGNSFRILIYKAGTNANLTLWAKDGVNEFILADTLKVVSPNEYNDFLLNCGEICLSGSNVEAQGEVKMNCMYLETYPENESVDIPEVVYEEDPGKPAGDFIDFTEAFPNLQPRIGVGADGHPIQLGNGDVVVGQRAKDVIADLSDYSKLTMVTSPNLKLVLYMNHEVDAQQNAGDYAEADAGKYVFMNVQADENGLIEVDLTQFDKQDLNCICLPWDNSNKGTVWYLLLTEKAVTPVHTWDFTQWSEATIANLKAEAAKVTVEDDPDKAGSTKCTDNGALWSDHEKATKCETYEASKDNCFWYVGGEAEPTANGLAIAELKGLVFDASYGTARSLAIAVNYPETSLGTYAGPAYLWLGGKNKNCFTIKNVKVGSELTMAVESHKPTEGRGVQLKIGGENFGDAFNPTTYEEKTWTITSTDEAATAVDVLVTNTNGCHIYYIDAEIDNTATAINTIQQTVVRNDAIYNVNGQQVKNPSKGLYIINGKKVIVK